MKRFKTRQIFVGNVAVGGSNPIRIQSMTNTKTEDVDATVDQILKLNDAGCEIVRMTVQGKKQAYALEHIKNKLLKKNFKIPLVADIHFYPPAAYIAADFVDKVRINPGNFAEKRAIFQKTIFTDDEYEKELIKIEEKLALLIEKLKKNKVALRIGVNHGSLSDRIMTKYGDSVEGMVASAIEYTKICQKLDYHDIIYSMKSSSSFVTIEAYRALVQEMKKLNLDYPIHLGVTEAGDIEDGIIKSSVGIGALLLDGIGDTIRVSLTADPTEEIKSAKILAHLTSNRVKTSLENQESKTKKISLAIKTKLENINKISMIDIFYLEDITPTQDNLQLIKKLKSQNKILISKDDFPDVLKIYTLKNISQNPNEKFALELRSNDNLEIIKNLNPTYIIFKPNTSCNTVDDIREFISFLQNNDIDIPIILNLKYTGSLENIKILASSELGLILYEKLAASILLEANNSKIDTLDLSLNILQACNLKRHKTEFIACPGCGRTLFDIQKVLKKIKEKTPNIADLKIAIMGCIVNGPGEMQDADFGYVGSGEGKIDLYIHKKCIEKNIDEKDAVYKLISLIEKKMKKEKIIL